jgi:hypothetical protein
MVRQCLNALIRLSGVVLFLRGYIIKRMCGKEDGSKTGGGVIKWFAAGGLILLFILAGLSMLALSAFFLLKSPGPEKKANDAPGPVCGPKEISSGASCCTDRNGNGICDIREDATTIPTVPVTQYIPPTTRPRQDPGEVKEPTTAAQSTTSSSSTTRTTPSTTSTTASTLISTTFPVTSTTTTTSLAGRLVSSCADKYGVSSDTVIYVYTPKCCEKTVSPIIERASKDRGYKYKYVAADALDKSAEGLLKCYLPPGYINVPQLICPANGNTRILTSQGTLDQIISFSQKCLEAAYA